MPIFTEVNPGIATIHLDTKASKTYVTNTFLDIAITDFMYIRSLQLYTSKQTICIFFD